MRGRFCLPGLFPPPPGARHDRTRAGGPQRHCDGWNKTTFCTREVGTELRERGTRAPSLALLARRQRSHERRMDRASRSQSLRWRFVRLSLRDPETEPSHETRSTGTGGSIRWRPFERERMNLVVRNVAKGACLPMMGRQWQECAITGHPPRAWRTRQLDPKRTLNFRVKRW
jgi:hypothetical protein